MTDQPNFINLNYTSFAKKESYKPPQTTNLFNKKGKKRQRFVPGGEWADDDSDVKETKVEKKQTNNTMANDFGFDLLDNEVKKEEEAPKEKTSKFAFIKKSKKTQKKVESEESDESVPLEFESIRSEK